MPITVEWVNPERTVLLYRFVDNWTWEDYHAANHLTREMLESVHHAVDLICDFCDSTAIPPRVLTNIGRSLRQRRPANINQIIAVGITGLLRNLADVLCTLYPAATQAVIHAHTLDHAYRLLSASKGQS
jgi:hypothetical protein